MIVRCTICVALCATLFAEVGSAQVSRSRTQTQQRQAVPARGAGGAGQNRAVQSRTGRAVPPRQAAARTTGVRTASASGTARPKAPPIDPVLDRLLKDWEISSDRIQKIEGQHLRRVYDMVFKVEKRSTGVFYHEVPDKGRIDIKPVRVPKGAKSDKPDPVSKRPFDLVGDLEEKWICDGKRIVEINEEEKSAHVIPIPPKGQGENIMNGPLPFLFGMKADVAKKRYQLALVGSPPKDRSPGQRIQIQAFPRWQTDGKNWKEARIILEYPSFVPKAVMLVDPAGTKETVFSFKNLKVELKPEYRRGPQKIFDFFKKWGRNPFRPDLRKYKVNTAVPGTGPEKPTINLAADELVVPPITGYDPKEATLRLQQAGFVVSKKWSRGGAPPMKNLELKVRTSQPKPMSVAKKGSTIKLVVYERQTKPASRTAAKK